MSHTTAIKGIVIKNIEAMQAAIEDLNAKGIKCSLVPNQIPRAFYQNQEGLGMADYVIKLEAAPYDIGLYKGEDGNYEPRTDFWAGHVAKVLGGKPTDPTNRENVEMAQMGKLFQYYGVNAAAMEARRQGKMVRRVENEETGALQLVITGY